MSTFTVTTLNDSGAGSLRAAITAANAAGLPSTIDFSVTGVIALATDLPAVSQTVTIDATSAPGYAGSAPVVGLDCDQHSGLVFAAGSDGSHLLGMSVCNASGNGVTLDAGAITLAGNYIGLDLAGNALGNSGDGVYVGAGSSGNSIGVNPTAASGVVSNIISGNAGNGITLSGSSANTLVDNYIGTNAAGTAAIANGGNGIWVTASSSGNEIGGTAFTDTTTGAVNDPTGNEDTVAAVFVVPPLGNLVSGNSQNGIRIDTGSQNNVLNGNFVGTTVDGNAAIGNALDGVSIDGADNNSLIGCQFVNNPFVYYNVVSGNGGNGLHVTDANNITVQANFFGIGANNTTTVGNGLDGILVDGSSQNVQVGGVIPLGNVSAGNGTNGIEVAGTASGFTTFNTFGGLLAFKGAAPNGNDGLLITSTGGNQTVQTNVFSGNTNNGIEIAGDASGVTVDPDIVGLTTSGGAVLANGNNGLQIGGTAHDNIIGGYQSSVIPQDTFSGNAGYGIAILDQAHNNQVFNSYVGTDVLGAVGLGNGAGGILVAGSATSNTIGGISSSPSQPVADVISGNGGDGVDLGSNTSFTQIENNVIGYGAAAIQQLPNAGQPIVVNSSTNNTISGNTIACFVAGTKLAAEHGDVPVEALSVGDLLWAGIGAARSLRPVTWIGHRRIDCARHRDPRDVWPVRVSKDALAPAVPARDLWLSPDHAMLLDGVLIPVRYLVNGRTIVRERRKAVHYFHVELARHDIVVAEGAPCESFLDTGNKADFSGEGKVVRLHPDFALRVWATAGCAKLVLGGAELEAARSFLLERARLLGHATTRRPDIRLLARGHEIRPHVRGRVHRFHVPAGARGVRLVSRSVFPAETHDASTEHRRLGVAVSAARYGGSPIALADPRLGAGWHEIETADDVTWRWTDGGARIALAGGRTLEIEIAMTECYWRDDLPVGARNHPSSCSQAAAFSARIS